MPAKLSRLAILIEQGKVRRDLEVKTFMDTLRMIARNLFCGHLKSFQPHYDNLRDDYAVLRNLTLCAGVWILEPDGPTIHLHPGILITRRNMQNIFDAFLAELPPPQPPHSEPVTLKSNLSERVFESVIRSAKVGS